MYGQTIFGGTVRGGRTTSSHHRGARTTRSGQTVVYPACATEQEALQCVLYVHNNATQIMAVGGDALGSVVHVSCAATLRDIMAGNGGGRGVFALDVKAENAAGAKAYLPGFCITLRREHHYTDASRARHVEPAGAYHTQIHWHEGEWRLTLDPVSKRTANSSSRRSVSHSFNYHGMPYLLEPVFRAWQSLRPRNVPPSGPRQSGQGLSLQDLHHVIQAQFLGVQFTESRECSPSWKEESRPLSLQLQHASPRAPTLPGDPAWSPP
jgi:hypothetical protein